SQGFGVTFKSQCGYDNFAELFRIGCHCHIYYRLSIDRHFRGDKSDEGDDHGISAVRYLKGITAVRACDGADGGTLDYDVRTGHARATVIGSHDTGDGAFLRLNGETKKEFEECAKEAAAWKGNCRTILHRGIRFWVAQRLSVLTIP